MALASSGSLASLMIASSVGMISSSIFRRLASRFTLRLHDTGITEPQEGDPACPPNREKLPKVALSLEIGPFSGTLQWDNPALMRRFSAAVARDAQTPDWLVVG
jgi:hypothetical protein